MSDVKLDWSFGPVSAKQKPVKETLVVGRTAPSLPFSELGRVAVPVTTLTLAGLAPGDWEFAAAAVDVDGAQGPTSSASLSIPSDAPSALASFSSTLV